MSIFDGVRDFVQNITGSVTDNLPVDDLQGMTDSLSETASNATDEASSKVDDVTNSLGL